MNEQKAARPGTVYIAGCSRGDAGLMTVRARALAATADLLIGPEEQRRRAGAEVATRDLADGGNLEAAVAAAAAGKVVVWLIPGDPLSDGDGLNLDRALQDAGVSVELLPGVPLAVSSHPAVLDAQRRRPLHGRTVVTTRPLEQSEEMVRWLNEAGASVIVWPTICIEPVTDETLVDAAIDTLGACRWVIFTSANGVRFFFQRLDQRRLDIRAFAGARVAAIGPATADALAARGLHVNLVPDTFQAEGLLESLAGEDLNGQRILIPRAEVARDVLPDTLRARGAQVEVLVVYRAVPPAAAADDLRRRIEAGDIDAITFTSSSTVSRFAELMQPADAAELLHRKNVTVACIGPITGGTARRLGFRVTVEAERFTIPDLSAALCRHFADA